MDVLKALGAEIYKMFVADLWLTMTALATVAVCAGATKLGLIEPGLMPPLLAGGVLAALLVGVGRGAGRR